MTKEISNKEDILDSRDIIERLEELESDFVAYCDDKPQDEEEEWCEEDFENWDELKALRSLSKEASGSPDWQYGETLIRDSYFQEYAQELAKDIGAIPKDLGWPCNCIDWEQAVRDLQWDYFSVDFDGIDYWIRA